MVVFCFLDCYEVMCLGTSNGLVPMLRVYNNTARYVDQGGGKRKGQRSFLKNKIKNFFF